jgi:uncharacterized membrane protein YozB (DUF420 family)
MNVLHLLSSIVVALITAGVWFRRRRPEIHVRIMSTAFLCDLALVLYIEATRHAVETVVGRGTSLIWFHATVSTLVLVAYIAQIAIGRRMLAGIHASRRTHVALGVTFVGLRSLNYVTSFLL